MSPSAIVLRRKTFGLLFLVAALCAAAFLVFGRRSPQPKWNVLMIVPDTVRADHLSINGYFRATTPNLDRLAREGTSFTQAITTAPQTWQSYTTIMTGLYPPHHGVRFHFDFALDPKTPTIATELKKAGYVAKCFDRLPFMRGMLGEKGFDEFHDVAFSTDGTVVQAAWQWISDHRDAPFFAFVRLNGPHWPYDATPAEMEDLDPCDGQDHSFNESTARLMGLGPGVRGKGMTLAKKDEYRRIMFDTNVSDRQRKHRIAHYDAELRQTDAHIGWLLDQLRANGLMEKTVIVASSDHGESFGEHGYWQHGPRVDEPVVRVPFILRLPEGHPLRAAGKTIDGQVRTVDIAPTVLAAAGAAIPGGLDGIDLLPFVGGEPLPDLWAYAETGKDFVGADPDLHVEGVAGKHRMARRGGWKLVYVPRPEGREYRLYNLREEDGERTNVAHEHPEKVKELLSLLQGILDEDEDSSTRTRQLTEAEKEQLRQLGYM